MIRLRAVFTAARIYPWRDSIQEAESRAARVNAITAALLEQRDIHGNPALALFVEVLAIKPWRRLPLICAACCKMNRLHHCQYLPLRRRRASTLFTSMVGKLASSAIRPASRGTFALGAGSPHGEQQRPRRLLRSCQIKNSEKRYLAEFQ